MLGTLQYCLTGQALRFWERLNPATKSSYGLVSAALKRRFPVPFQYKQHPRTMAEMLAEVVQQIEEEAAIEEVVVVVESKEQTTAEIFAEAIKTVRQEVAIEEAEILAEVIQHIEEEVAIEEMVVVIEPEERAMEKRKQHPSAEAEIPAKVIQPIEEKVAMEELVVVVEQERQSMEECQQRPSVMTEIPAEVVLVIQPIEEEVATEEVGVIQPIEEKVAMKKLVVVVEPKEQVMEGVTVVNPVEVGSGMIAIEGVIPDISEQSTDEQSGVEVITTAPIEAEAVIKDVVVGTEPDEQAIEGVNGVNYKDFRAGMVPTGEHITIAEDQVQDTADNIDTGNSYTRDYRLSSTGYDPGGRAYWLKQDHVRREARLRLKRNIAGISWNASAEALGHRDALAIAGSASYIELFRHAEEAVWLKSSEIEIDRILPAKVPRYVAPELGDLVLRRRFQVDKSLGMKLHTKWDGPYLLSRIAKSGVSGDLEDLKTGKVIGRYAFESLKVYSTYHENKDVRIADG